MAPPASFSARARAFWRLGLAIAHAGHGLLIANLLFPWIDRATRERCIAWWSGRLFGVLGVRIEQQGCFADGGKLIVANHVSWLDVMAVHAICPEARFVAMAEVRQWQWVARLVDCARTIYLDRGRRRDLYRVVGEVAEALREGACVAVFPEGRVSDGTSLLPFHGNLLQSAIASGAPVQPVALRYDDASGAVSAAVLFTGDITLGQSLWRLACAERLVLRMQVLPALARPFEHRRVLARRLRADIALRIETTAPATGVRDADAGMQAPVAAS